MLRTHTCGELTKSNIGKSATICGWVNTRRDHGGIIFIDLRDRYGLTQAVFNPDSKFFKEADKLRREDCIQVSGKVVSRKEGMINKNLKTGEVELVVDTLHVLNKSEVPPIEIDDRVLANEEMRLKYRYLDLRRPVMQQRLIFRHNVAQAAREYLSSQGFLEIETPLLIKSTPEGARDYVVPSRVHPGSFYALPQSPQLFKQILMVAGLDKYYQLARCLRDEDLRADRQPEHTQIDLEMSFVEREDVIALVENLYKHIFKKILNLNLSAFPALSYDDAMNRFGTDKPDMRFGLELVDIHDIAKKSEFKVFQDAESVKCLPVNKDMTRGDIDKLIDWAKEQGSKGLAWMKVTDKGLESSIVKFFSPELQKKLLERSKIKSGVLFFIADSKGKTNEILGKLRNKLGQDLKLIKENEFKFCWILDFPMFEFNADEDKWDFGHNPFCMPKKEHLPLLEKDPGKVYCDQYDLVLNGIELGSGSIRINRPDIQERAFKVTGMTQERARDRFGFLLEAYTYGGPPHGGMGLGLDRLVALMQGINDIREVIAFPKTKSAESPMDGSPSALDAKDLAVLKLKIEQKEKK